jgi:hypothetical protein
VRVLRIMVRGSRRSSIHDYMYAYRLPRTGRPRPHKHNTPRTHDGRRETWSSRVVPVDWSLALRIHVPFDVAFPTGHVLWRKIMLMDEKRCVRK